MKIDQASPPVAAGRFASVLPLRDLLLALTFPLLVGAGFVASKVALEQVPPVLLSAVRYTICSLVLVWFFPPPLGALWRLFLVALVSVTIQLSLTYAGFARLDVSTAALLVQSEVPFLIILSALATRRWPGRPQLLGTALGLAGTVIVLGAPSLRAEAVGAAFVLSGSLAWAAGQLMAARMTTGMEAFRLTTWISVFASLQLWPLSCLIEGNPVPYLLGVTPLTVGAFVFLGLGTTALGFGIWYGLVGRHGVARTAPFLLLIPVFAVLLGMALLGDALRSSVVAGGLLTLAGVALTLRREKARPGAQAG